MLHSKFGKMSGKNLLLRPFTTFLLILLLQLMHAFIF